MNNEILWEAVKQNDTRYDGVFYTCVTSTKIYCKPSCPARLPKRENVFFVGTSESAENKGFRACLRCKPKEHSALDTRVQTAVKACEIIEAEGDASLAYLSEMLGVSQSHFQRTFKKIIGVSPKKYAEQRRLDRFKGEIKKGSAVTDALYEAGFGSSSRLYEKASKNLGMTPAVYKKGGEGVTINYSIVKCSLGRLLVAKTEKGICGVKFGDLEEELVEDLRSEYEKAEIFKDTEGLTEYVGEVLKYLEGSKSDLELPIDVRATAFQMRVWEALRNIPYGETLSYKQVAEKIGKPRAVRAVASACARNQVALIIPCHRVIGSSGKMSGYRWGIERKKKILAIEKIRE